MTEAFWGDELVWLRRAAGMVDAVAQADVSAGKALLRPRYCQQRNCQRVGIEQCQSRTEADPRRARDRGRIVSASPILM